MCCGVGNLETKHSNPRNVFMSTLDQPDVDVMAAAKTCRAATRFQYDYLNDDIAEDGSIDYAITGKVPQNLRDAIAAAKVGRKKFLVLINPPYAEAGKGTGKGNKEGVSNENRISGEMRQFGFAKRELFVQFLYRVAKEIPGATLAMQPPDPELSGKTFFCRCRLGQCGNGSSYRNRGCRRLTRRIKQMESMAKKVSLPMRDRSHE